MTNSSPISDSDFVACKKIKETHSWIKSGYFTVEYQNEFLKFYCEMESGGGEFS